MHWTIRNHRNKIKFQKQKKIPKVTFDIKNKINQIKNKLFTLSWKVKKKIIKKED